MFRATSRNKALERSPRPRIEAICPNGLLGICAKNCSQPPTKKHSPPNAREDKQLNQSPSFKGGALASDVRRTLALA